MIEIRWHARAGQGAKTAAQLLAEAMLRAGKSVQAFPEYGPERRGAPMRAYTRVDECAIRRHDSIESPDVVVVLDPSLANETATSGLKPGGLMLVNSEERPVIEGADVRAVPASRLAETAGAGFVNIVMLGAVARALGAPPLPELEAAAVETLGRKADPEIVRTALKEGYAWAT